MTLTKNKKWWIGTIIAVISVLIALFAYFKKEPKQAPKAVSSVNFGNNANINTHKGDISIVAGDQITRNIQGINERELKKYLSNLKTKTVLERKKEIQDWYEKAQINANLKEALTTVVERIDEELKASQKTIKKLRAEGKLELAKLLERLNKAFEKGLDAFVKEEAKVLEKIKTEKTEIAEKEIEFYLNTAKKYHTVLQYTKAINRYNLALELQEKHFGMDTERYSFISNWLGFIHNTLANYAKAIEFFEKALKIDLKVFGGEHPNVATRYNNLGSVWKAKGQDKKATEYFQKSLDILIKKVPENHPYIRILRKKLKINSKIKQMQPKRH